MKARLRLALCAFLSLSPAAYAQDLHCQPDQVIFVTPSGTQTVQVEIADTPDTRAQGLMNRTDLPRGTGMLFIYETPRPASFWMRNTLIPLDMVFVDSRGVIRHIHANATPHDETPIPGNQPNDADPDRLMVVELPAGEAARLGLQPGQAMAHPRLAKTSAAAPCN